MATVSNANDPNRVSATTSNVAPQQQATAPAAQQAGQYSTLQKYLSANKNAGQRLGSALGNTVNTEAQSLQTATGQAVDESGKANQNIVGLTDQTKQIKTNLSTPVGPAPVDPTKKAYDVNSYSSNLSGSQAAASIANNEEDLNKFYGITSGDTLSGLKQKSDEQAQAAFNTSQKQLETNLNRQKDLANADRRAGLLSQALNSKNQRLGLQNLDNAFLSQDKTKSVDQIRNNLMSQTQGLQNQNQEVAKIQDTVNTLAKDQNLAQEEVVSRVKGMSDEYDQELNRRKDLVNAAKDARVKKLRDDYQAMINTGDVTYDLQQALQFDKMIDAEAVAREQAGATTGKMTANNTRRAFKALDKYQDLDTALDFRTLNDKAAQGADVANKQDIEKMNIINKLLRRDPTTLKESKFQGSQLGESKVLTQANKEAQDFLDNMNNRIMTGAEGDAKIDGWRGGTVAVDSSLADMLYKDQLRKMERGYNDQRIDNTFSGGYQTVEGNKDASLSDYANQLNPFLRDLSGGYGFFNGPRTTNFADRSSINAATHDGNRAGLVKAENRAVENLRNEVNQRLQSRGYNNLIKLMQRGESDE